MAEMLNGKIELVDLEDARRPMTTYGQGGPVLFTIAHQNVSEDTSYKCDHWVLTDLGPTTQKEARLRIAIEEKFNGKQKTGLRSATSKYAAP